MGFTISKRVGVVSGLAAILGAAALVTGPAQAANLITGSQIKDGTITQADIAASGVSGHGLTDESEIMTGSINQTDIRVAGVSGSAGDGEDEIQKGSLGLDDFSPAAKAGLKGDKGDQGEQGEQGAKGDTGEQGEQGEKGDTGAKGDPGVNNLIAGAGYTQTWAGDGGAELQTSREECPAGQYALGGGYSTWGGDKDLGGNNKNIQVTVSAPYFEGDYIPVDDAGNFRPTEWVVKGYNNGTTDQIVRAWVVCADINTTN